MAIGPDCENVTQRQKGLQDLRIQNILIAGGGNLAQASAAFLSRNNGTGCKVSVLTRQPEKWNAHIKAVASPTSIWAGMDPITGNLHKISFDPAHVVPEADLIIVAAPATAHLAILEKIAPFTKKGAIVGTVFGQGCFDLCVRQAYGDKLSELRGYFALLHVPWLAYVKTYGQEVQFIGPKEFYRAAVMPTTAKQDIKACIELCFERPCNLLPNFLSTSLTPSNQIIHPARYYEIFKDWDGFKVYQESEIQWGLYSQFGEEAASWLAKLDAELQAIAKGLKVKCPVLDLSYVVPIKQRIEQQYGDSVLDTSSLRTVFTSNKGYAGCRTPARKVEGGFQPAVSSRLFEEDIPHGLCVLKNLAELVGIETPATDFMIEWHQQFMPHKYLVNGKLNPETIHLTSAPARFGITTLEQLIESQQQGELRCSCSHCASNSGKPCLGSKL